MSNYSYLYKFNINKFNCTGYKESLKKKKKKIMIKINVYLRHYYSNMEICLNFTIGNNNLLIGFANIKLWNLMIWNHYYHLNIFVLNYL